MPDDEQLLWSIAVYRIELYDPINQETDTTIVVACTLIDAINCALSLFNDSVLGPPLTLENVIDAQRLTNDQLFFTKKARYYLGERYSFQKKEYPEQTIDKA